MSGSSILIIEDDKEISQLLTHCLIKEGYKTYAAFDGKEALSKLSSISFHLVVLDLMIPHIDGFEVLRKIREKGNIPVIILSAKADITDKIIGLGLGADDYLTKPFYVDELIARVKSQLRRYLNFNNLPEEHKEVLKYNDIEMDLNNCKVLVAGKQVSLTAKEFEILKLFISNPKKVFTKSRIFSSVWGEEYLSDENTIIVHIRRLREKIEPDPSKPRYIQTIWGFGYKLCEE